jgi:hypothetical protein
MDSRDFTHAQAEVLREQLRRQLDYLVRLLVRMRETGFPDDDPVRVKVRDAERAVRAAWMVLHTVGMSTGVARVRGRLIPAEVPLGDGVNRYGGQSKT